jgi:hypothetical protein
MSDEREAVLKENEDADVEAHAVLKASDEKTAAEDAEAPDVEAHAVLKSKAQA